MYNKETVIRLNTLDDVQEFVGAASKCDFDIDLKYRQILIDEKSLLGVIFFVFFFVFLLYGR